MSEMTAAKLQEIMSTNIRAGKPAMSFQPWSEKETMILLRYRIGKLPHRPHGRIGAYLGRTALSCRIHQHHVSQDAWSVYTIDANVERAFERWESGDGPAAWEGALANGEPISSATTAAGGEESGSSTTESATLRGSPASAQGDLEADDDEARRMDAARTLLAMSMGLRELPDRHPDFFVTGDGPAAVQAALPGTSYVLGSWGNLVAPLPAEGAEIPLDESSKDMVKSVNSCTRIR